MHRCINGHISTYTRLIANKSIWVLPTKISQFIRPLILKFRFDDKSFEQTQQTQALLKIFALGNEQIKSKKMISVEKNP